MAIKTHKVTLSLDNPRVIQSGINVQSFDKQSIQISIELTKNDEVFQVPSDATIRISLLKLARQEQKIIVDVPNTNRDSIDWIVPDYLDGYQGTVRVGVYLVSGAENVDLGYFTILSNVSDIDKMADEFTDNVFQGWEQIEADLNELNLTIAQTKLDLAEDLTQIDNTIANINTLASDFTADVATKQADVTSKYNAFDTDITEANQTIDDILALQPQFQSVLDETTGKDVISAPEIILARGGALTLGERLEEDKAEVTAQLAQTEQTFATRLLDTAKKSDIGSPLTASSVSEMTDVTRVYVNTTDGNWYTHNGTGWVSGGLYNSQAIADKSISPIKNSYPTIQGTYSLNKNKFDKSTAIHGKYFDHTSGALLEYPDRFLSQKMAVKVGEKYRKTYGHAVALYGKNDNFVLGLPPGDESVIVIPTGVTYALLTGLITEMETAMFFTGETLPPYESGLPKLPPELIADGSITAKKVDFPVLETQESTNIADLSLAVDGYYVDYTNGLLQPAVGFTAVRFLKVSPNKTYIKSYGQQMAFYARESEDSYISGQASGEMFTTPPNCNFVGVTIENDYLDTYRINEGDTLLPFETYGDKISEKNIPMSVLKTSKSPSNIVSIAKEGGDFSKPSEALMSVSDSKENPITLQIAPGVYSDSLNGWGRYVSVIGVDREHCVIKNDLNDYYRPPVDAGPNNVYKNLTIHAQADESTKTNEMPSYGVHFDLSGRGLDLDDEKYQGTCLFENCNLYSDYTHGLGAGLSKKTKLVFRNCDFYSPRLSALRIHGYMPAELATEQNAEFINCRMWNGGSFEPIVLQDPNISNPDTFDTEFTFQNCVAWNDDGQNNLLSVSHAPTTSDDVVGNIKLGKGSFGNNISALNK